MGRDRGCCWGRFPRTESFFSNGNSGRTTGPCMKTPKGIHAGTRGWRNAPWQILHAGLHISGIPRPPHPQPAGRTRTASPNAHHSCAMIKRHWLYKTRGFYHSASIIQNTFRVVCVRCALKYPLNPALSNGKVTAYMPSLFVLQKVFIRF